MVKADDVSRSLDHVERQLWSTSPLFGDRYTEWNASIRSQQSLPLSIGSSRTIREAPTDESEHILLDGEWLLAGAYPGREFSIDRWAGDRSKDALREPVDWYREDTDRSDWVSAIVPGTVQGALVAAGVTEDPMLDDATHRELTQHGVPRDWPWFFRRTRIEQQEWWYARRFVIPPSWLGRRMRLSFDGIDYAASVFLNGMPIARHRGMYGGPEIDVSAIARVGSENELVVRIDPPPRDWHGVMKPSPGWGWHYGHLISMGIWRSVRLESMPPSELADLFASTSALDDDTARLRVQWDVVHHQANVTALPASVVIRDPDGRIVADAEVDLVIHAGTTRHHIDLNVSSPRLWWPLGYGEQPMYTVEVRANGHSVLASFGIRTIEMRALPRRKGPDTYDWQFAINGRELFIKGANWCWTDPMVRRGPEVDRHILELVARANLQMLRAWGGGTVESDDFYAECDRRGILVLQEFPLTFGLDSTDADLAAIDEQTGRIVRRLRNHPSLIMWGGGNEQPAGITSDDLLTVIGRRVTQYDPSRPFHRTDPWGGSEHFYGVYHEGMPVESYRDHVPAVFGEYGLSSQCNVSSMHRFLDPGLLEKWPPVEHGAILQHQAQFSLFDLYKQARYAHYGPIRDWATFVEYSQLAQGDALRYASERIRAHSGSETSAYWFYKVGEAFPGASWAVIDYYGVPKLSYYRAKQFSAPISAYAVYDRFDWAFGETFRASIHVSNDTPRPLADASLIVRLYDADLRLIADRRALVYVDPDGRVDALELIVDLTGARIEPLVLSVELRDAEGIHVSSAWYPFNHQPKSAELKALEAMPLQDLANREVAELMEWYAEGRSPLSDLPRTRLRAHWDQDAIVITNVGEHPAPIVLIDGFPHNLGDVLDDNAFGLSAGQSRRIAFVSDGALEAVSVRAWNADAVRPT